MSIVTLVSGGLDSTLMSMLIKEEDIEQYPLFIDYGQHAKKMEWETCLKNHKKFELPKPKMVDLEGFGELIKSGLTDKSLDIKNDVFLPNRNLMFLLVASSYAYQVNANAVAIGLLNEKNNIFVDQTEDFIEKAENLISLSLERDISIVAPLMEFNKTQIIELAKQKEISNTYSCHSGNKIPCGKCIACLEIINSKED